MLQSTVLPMFCKEPSLSKNRLNITGKTDVLVTAKSALDVEYKKRNRYRSLGTTFPEGHSGFPEKVTVSHQIIILPILFILKKIWGRVEKEDTAFSSFLPKILHILPLVILRILLFVHQEKTGCSRSQAAGYARWALGRSSYKKRRMSRAPEFLSAFLTHLSKNSHRLFLGLVEKLRRSSLKDYVTPNLFTTSKNTL